ncbi:glycosyl hydrolase catalytic core-domain-containing protein [Hyaloraphidium curvatum]|nr:glycosyl hydrolase catalytic core-domain-containing protein [Hyaloraphidium curvatum]
MPYNWQTPNPVLFGASANPPWEYVPMQWSPANIASLDANLATLSTRQTTRVLLGWNEPDRADQANISPAVGAQQWYLLERAAAKYGLRLGGPAIGSSPPWLDSWYTECDKYYCIEASFGGTGTTCQAASTLGASVCKQCAGKPYGQRGCRVDFNPVHIYNCDFTKFVAELDKRTVKYGQPVWVTEFGCMPTWEWPAYPYPLAQGYAPMTAYAQQLLAYLDGRADIERYAWWTHQAASADGAYIYHQLYSSHFQLSPVGNVYKTYGISPATPVTTATATTQTPVMATTVTFAAPTSSPLPSGASLTTAWNASLARCSFNQSIGGLGEPLDARACANPVVDAMPGQRTSYDGPFRPSCDLRWWGASQACGALTRAARTVFIGDSLTKHVHDELHALLREDAELGYMSPLTPSTINATCRCQSPYLMENNQQCKNYAQSSMGRNKTEHWYSPTVWKYWYTSDICAKRSLVDYFGMFTDWTTDTASMNIMADLETVIQQASSSVVVVVGGTPPYSQLGTGAYNAAYNCDNVLKPIAALFAKYGIPYSRLVVLGMHRIEQKTWVDGNNAPVEAFNSGWQACAGANAPGSAFVDSYGLSTAGSASYTEDGLHGGVRINMLKVQVVLQQVGAM